MQRAIDKLEPFQRAISKAHLAAAGVSIDSLENPDKPLIAIANSWNELCPGHEPLRQLAPHPASLRSSTFPHGGKAFLLSSPLPPVFPRRRALYFFK